MIHILYDNKNSIQYVSYVWILSIWFVLQVSQMSLKEEQKVTTEVKEPP